MTKLNHENFKKKALQDPSVKKAYDALQEEFDLMSELIKARKISGKTQLQVAKTMHTSASVISRLESGNIADKNSPSINTLKRYAKAVGCKLKITLEPQEKY